MGSCFLPDGAGFNFQIPRIALRKAANPTRSQTLLPIRIATATVRNDRPAMTALTTQQAIRGFHRRLIAASSYIAIQGCG